MILFASVAGINIYQHFPGRADLRDFDLDLEPDDSQIGSQPMTSPQRSSGAGDDLNAPGN